ncbi:polysaccharide biosynthesis protein [Natronomonas gomsonensis]|uniref:polysaccharide biosynthesis protein n=1 Tax=Natronomonas gomsonensis TaxID=1046043 RepID=UPI00227A132C|nr:polysaccharide biosynthesis protein [Natronomonas gomsonensis]MCY4732123.1 polysaccharide biosynthesis protein [Natronomonas gomsonensis]
MIHGSTVLLTGGAGSVGRSLIPRLLDRDPQILRILDNSESGLASLKSELSDDRCRFFAGDIRDSDRLSRAMVGVDIVIHTAAMKHVDICEYNPFEAVKTNALGLQNVVDAAISANVNRFVFTSSDKAVDPANTMGTTKLLGEKLVTAGNTYSGGSDIDLASVRFGNVIKSSQSVIPLFTEQIRGGGPVTLTDERMTRFFLTYDDVFDLVTGAAEKTTGGEVFVYKMPAIRIPDLADAMIETLAPTYGYSPEDIEIEVIGPRPGETFHEEIMTDRESRRAYENGSMYAILPEATETRTPDPPEGFEEVDDLILSSKNAEKLSKSEIVSLLETNGSIKTTNE